MLKATDSSTLKPGPLLGMYLPSNHHTPALLILNLGYDNSKTLQEEGITIWDSHNHKIFAKLQMILAVNQVVYENHPYFVIAYNPRYTSKARFGYGYSLDNSSMQEAVADNKFLMLVKESQVPYRMVEGGAIGLSPAKQKFILIDATTN